MLVVNSWRLGGVWRPHYLPEVANNCGGPGPNIPKGSNVLTSSLGKMMGAVHDEMYHCIEGAETTAKKALFGALRSRRCL